MNVSSLKSICGVPSVTKPGSVFGLGNVNTLYVPHYAFHAFMDVQCVPMLKEAGTSLHNE
jgi:hypothetical protein